MNIINNNAVSIKYSQKEHVFTIYHSDKILGYISIVELIKNFTYDIDKNFLENYDYEHEIPIIENYFYKIKNGKIIFIDYINSPFMGNIELIMNLINDLYYFENNVLESELLKISNSKQLIVERINEFNYLLLNHALKLIVKISDIIKNDISKKNLKLSLIKYSEFIMKKINYLIYDIMKNKNSEYNSLKINIDQLTRMTFEFDRKIKIMEDKINIQSDHIAKLLSFININNIDELYVEDEINKPHTENNASCNNSMSEDNYDESQNLFITEEFDKKNVYHLTPNE